MTRMVPPAYAVLARLPLGLHEPLQGRPGTRFTREAGVVIGRPIVARLASGDFPAGFTARTDLESWDYLSIRFPFDLEEARYGQRYLEAQYQVALIDLDAVALRLETVPLFRPDVFFLEGERLTTFGHGQRVFRWKLSTDDDGELTQGSRVARAVLQLPPGLAALHGVISVSAILTGDDPDDPLTVHEPDPQPFTLDLSGGGFDLDPRPA